jgi:hypothetical protein
VYGFNEAGNQILFANAASTQDWSPAVDSSGFYTFTGGTLTMRDLLTGAPLHQMVDPISTSFSYRLGGAPVLAAPGSVVVADYENAWFANVGNRLMNFRIGSNSLNWQVEGAYPTTPAYRDGVIYAVNNKTPARLEARAETDGALLWFWAQPRAEDQYFLSEVLLTKNLAFVTTSLATYAIDLKTHQAIFSYPASGKLALSQNGVLYIQSSKELIALNLK